MVILVSAGQREHSLFVPATYFASGSPYWLENSIGLKNRPKKVNRGLLHKIVCFETYLPVGTNLEVGTFCITKFDYINIPTPQIRTYRKVHFKTNNFMEQALYKLHLEGPNIAPKLFQKNGPSDFYAIELPPWMISGLFRGLLSLTSSIMAFPLWLILSCMSMAAFLREV